MLSVQEGGDKFTSGEYRGPSHQSQRSEEELLAAEMMRTSSGREAETSQESAQLKAVSGVRSVNRLCETEVLRETTVNDGLGKTCLERYCLSKLMPINRNGIKRNRFLEVL